MTPLTPGRRCRVWRVVLIWLAIAGMPDSAGALDYPTRTVRVVIPFSAGGAPDVLFRGIAQALSEKWGQGVIVENRPGANTYIGATTVTKSAADGYTLLLTSDGTFIFNPLLYNNMPYAVSELAPVTLVATGSNIFAISKRLPANSVSEFVALAKARPGMLNYGSTGPGSIQRLQMELFANITGVNLIHIPFRGANETTAALLAGEVDSTITGASNILPHVPTGALKALAITSLTRSPIAPDLPTMQEAGIPGYNTPSLFGLFAPASTPADIKAKLHADIAEVLQRPALRKAIEERSFVIRADDPDTFQKKINEDTEKWRAVITMAGIKGD